MLAPTPISHLRPARWVSALLALTSLSVHADPAALLFGGVPIYIAVRGLFRGAIPAPWKAPDIVLAQAPLQFLLACAVFAGAGVLLAVLIVKGIWRARVSSR